MNQQRLRSYIHLIQQLLACPSGEEWILLRQNEALVTPELVQVMEQVATQLANQGNLKEAKFLHNLAGQIHHLFVSKTIQPTDPEDNSQVYLELIKALLDCPNGSEEELLTANQALIGPGLVQMMQQVATQLTAKGDRAAANYLQHWAMELNRRWLQEHDFQSTTKQEPEPKHPDYPPITRPSTPPEPAPIPVSQSRAAVPDEAEDVWAELSAELPPANPLSQPSSPRPAAVVEPRAVAPDEAEDVWADLSAEADQSQPAPPLTVPPRSLPEMAIYEQLTRHLETIAGALTKLSETLNPPTQPPTNPLWYMEVLERAQAANWVLTSAEIHTLIGVQPTCHHESNSFQRGCWIFVKVGKVGGQTGWRVKKDEGGEGHGEDREQGTEDRDK